MTRTWLITGVAILLTISASAAVPAVSLSIDASLVREAHHEVVPIDERAVGDALRGGALRAGIAVNGPDAAPVLVRVTGYHSGSRFGGSKTATITADVLIRDRLFGTIGCAHTAKLDFRSTEKRNVSAVDGCLADLGQQFGERLNEAMMTNGR